ncbi:MAG: hypothetical protein AAFO84_17450 [Cyanobacteria bacterium J06598_1]
MATNRIENWREDDDDEGVYDVWEYYTRVSRYREWIQSVIRT